MGLRDGKRSPATPSEPFALGSGRNDFLAGLQASAMSDSEGETTAPGRPCPQCGATMVHRHCEYVCPQHGVVFDCADTFY